MINKGKFSINLKRKLIFLSVLTLFLTFVLAINVEFTKVDTELSSQANNYLVSNTVSTNKEYIYLSDLNFITTNSWSYNGWSGHEIQNDKNQEGGALSLIVNGEKRTFTKGVSVHAKGQVTYDIEEFSTKYPRFIAYIGVDAARGTNGSIWFQISVSQNGTNWESLLKTEVLSGNNNAIDVDLDVTGYKYLRIYVDPNGSNAADHATIANARLVKSDFDKNFIFYNKLHKLEYYDAILREHDAEYNYNHNYRLILEREFVRKIGYWNIQDHVEHNPEMIETLDWLLESDERLEQLIEVGEVLDGLTFLKSIDMLYRENKSSLSTQNGYVYQKMIIGLAAAYRTDRMASPLTFSTAARQYDILERFRLVKKLFDEGQFMRTEEFKTYHVQLMRYVMQDAVSNEETLWLNALSKTKSNPLSHYSYLAYRLGPNYSRPEYRDLANKEKYDKKYMLTQYGVPYGDNTTRYWMAMEYGGICWNLSRTGQSVHKVNGIPSVGIYQPQHEAYLTYSQDSNGNGLWGANYNVFGWGKSCTRWYGGNTYRMLFNWGEKYFTDKAVNAAGAGNNAGYMLLGQAALNDRENFMKSLYYNLLANSYEDNETKLNMYFEGLEFSNLNLDSYDYIISLYKTMNKSSDEWHELADKIIDAYTFYPMAMNDLLKVIKPYLNGPQKVDIDLKEYAALTRAYNAKAGDVLQVDPTRNIAGVLLGKTKAQLATFSFDGENAGKIVIDEAYSEYDFNLYYSVDGGQTVSAKTTNHVIELSQEEISRINEEDNILVMMDGTPQVYTINIGKGTMPTNLYANDLENRVIGVDLTFEWRNSESDAWTSYADASPDNTGDKVLYVRKGASGPNVASDATLYTFTADNQPDTRKYIPVSHLSIEGVSAEESTGLAKYAIDGNYNTRWLNSSAGTDPDKYIIIKFDRLTYLSAIDYVPHAENGKILDGEIWVSSDGINYNKIKDITGWANNQSTKTIEFDKLEEPIQYIKIVGTNTSYTNAAKRHIGARMFNFYQDITENIHPTAGIGYSTTELTNKPVTVRLVSPSTNITITNNDGSDTYVFKENGKFTFEFVDDDGNKGMATAKVDWIDKTIPTATIEYSKDTLTNETVIATLKSDKDIKVINNGYYRIDENGNVYDKDNNIIEGYTVDENGNVKDITGKIVDPFSYEFISNGEFTFEFVDKAGNKGTATAKVDWIDLDSPEAIITYDYKTFTNNNVTVTLSSKEDIIITNNGGKNTYTFKENGEFTFNFKDLAGNENTVTARVDWIDKTTPTAKLKYEKVGNKVIVYVVEPNKEIYFQVGNGIYEFDKNGSYEIYFFDKYGNKGKVIAVINDLEDGGTKKNDTISIVSKKNVVSNSNSDYEDTMVDNKLNNSEEKFDSDSTDKVTNTTVKRVKTKYDNNSLKTGIYIGIISIIAILGIIVGILLNRKKRKNNIYDI